VGQVAFVVWSIRNGVYAYACKNTKSIEDDMRSTIKNNRMMAKKKRGPLSTAKKQFCALHVRRINLIDNSDAESEGE